ncbi:MAG: hypothetical protein ACO38U_07530 [Burkholderiaceae bacterium]
MQGKSLLGDDSGIVPDAVAEHRPFGPAVSLHIIDALGVYGLADFSVPNLPLSDFHFINHKKILADPGAKHKEKLTESFTFFSSKQLSCQL